MRSAARALTPRINHGSKAAKGGRTTKDAVPARTKTNGRALRATPTATSPAQALERIHSFAAVTPHPIDPSTLDLDRVWNHPWSTLSGGDRQRAHLLLTLATGPQVLLLDEPTSALDPDLSAVVEERIAGRTAVWITHDAEQAHRVATRVHHLGSS